MDLKITCTRCNKDIGHSCNSDMEEALTDLMTYRLESCSPEFLEYLKSSSWYREGDEDLPVLGGDFMYTLFDSKDTGRSMRGLMNFLIQAAGFDPYTFRQNIAMQVSEVGAVQGKGNLKALSSMDRYPLVQEGWSVGVPLRGFGIIPVPIQGLKPNKRRDGPRGEWDYFVHVGDSWIHMRKLYGMVAWVKDAEGVQVWGEGTNGEV